MFGIPINSYNYKSQNSEGIWYYDPTNNVLHLREGNMTVGTQNTPIIVINGDVNPTLTIQVDGACLFHGLFSHGIRFEGNGYSEEWKQEAARRGLDVETNVPKMFCEFTKPASVEMFTKTGVYTEKELEARNEVKWETYVKKV